MIVGTVPGSKWVLKKNGYSISIDIIDSLKRVNDRVRWLELLACIGTLTNIMVVEMVNFIKYFVPPGFHQQLLNVLDFFNYLNKGSKTK